MSENELLNYPFNVNVWGTVSDWVTVIATVIGLIYIIRTFRSQIEVQQSQIALLQIETDRFVDEKKPHFELAKIDFTGEQVDVDKPNFITELKKAGQLDALELKIAAHGFEIENLSPSDIHKEHDILIILYYKKVAETPVRAFHSFITYKDRYGNHYRQVINSWRNYQGQREYSISIPRMNESFTQSGNN